MQDFIYWTDSAFLMPSDWGLGHFVLHSITRTCAPPLTASRFPGSNMAYWAPSAGLSLANASPGDFFCNFHAQIGNIVTDISLNVYPLLSLGHDSRTIFIICLLFASFFFFFISYHLHSPTHSTWAWMQYSW